MFENKNQRDADFYEQCKQIILNDMGYTTLKQAINQAITMSAKSYYITDGRISRIIHSKSVPLSKVKRLLFYHLKRLYIEYNKIENGITVSEVSRIISSSQCAPRYYITQASAKRIYYNELKRRKLRLLR